MDVKGHSNFLCWSRELFVGESVRWFLCEGNELGDFCHGFDVKFSCSAYYYSDDDDIYFQCAMMLEGLFERFIDGYDVVYDFLSYVSVSGVFAFDKL